MTNAEPVSRFSHTLPGLNFSLNLLYVGRFLAGMNPDTPDDCLEEIDERIEAVTDELVSTELLHEAAVLVGDVLPDGSGGAVNQDTVQPTD